MSELDTFDIVMAVFIAAIVASAGGYVGTKAPSKMRGRLAAACVGFALCHWASACLTKLLMGKPISLPGLEVSLSLGSLVGTVAEFTLRRRIARGEVEAAPEHRF